MIQVATIAAANNSGSYEETARGLMSTDGVSDYCDFDHPIIEIGSTQIKGKLELKTSPVKIFSCIYRGKQRSSNFDQKVTQGLVDDIKKEIGIKESSQ